MVVWPGDSPVVIRQTSHLAEGDNATVSELSLSAHTGTHVDAPAHFIPGGAGVDALDLNVLVGPAFVVEVLDADVITAEVLESLKIPQGIKRLLFKTRNSRCWLQNNDSFDQDFVALTQNAARYLIDRGIQLVGIDYLSVAPFENGVPTHRELLGAGIVVVEGLNLNGIEPGRYQLAVLPLKIAALDGAPARAILIDE
jgi:arylformamidase